MHQCHRRCFVFISKVVRVGDTSKVDNGSAVFVVDVGKQNLLLCRHGVVLEVSARRNNSSQAAKISDCLGSEMLLGMMISNFEMKARDVF